MALVMNLIGSASFFLAVVLLVSKISVSEKIPSESILSQWYFWNEGYSVSLLISLLLAFSCFGEREESWLKFDVKEFRSPKIVTYHYYSILSRAVYGGSKPLFRLVINHCARGIIVPCKIELKVKSLLETRAVELIKGW